MKSAHVKKVQQNLAKISIVLLITLLFSFFVHAQHHSLVVDVQEAQQCKLCHHNIDVPPDFVIFAAIAQTPISITDTVSSVLYLPWVNYIVPPLRAPPVQK